MSPINYRIHKKLMYKVWHSKTKTWLNNALVDAKDRVWIITESGNNIKAIKNTVILRLQTAMYNEPIYYGDVVEFTLRRHNTYKYTGTYINLMTTVEHDLEIINVKVLGNFFVDDATKFNTHGLQKVIDE